MAIVYLAFWLEVAGCLVWYDPDMKDLVRWVVLGALFLVPATPLIVANSYFFPFITGKAFFFRILVEIALAAWVVLALVDKRYRPQYSVLGAIMVALVVWMGVADAFAVNAAKAFWSNFERMEGWVWLAHLLGFFVVASNVLRVEKQWRTWFLASLSVAGVVTLHALLQLAGVADIHQSGARLDASFGNSAYLAVYLLLNVFVALWLALTEKRTWLRYVLMAFAGVQGVLIFFTETRGTIVGLVGALVLATMLTALTAGKQARAWSLGALAVLLILVGGFYLARDSRVVQENRILNRIATISLEGGQTRFTIWSMALEGAKERPLTGWGQEGFNYVFNQYYKPSLYGQESWFDRAHNVYLDWLVAGGVPAFLLYVALFGAAVLLLWQHTELSRPERIMLTAAFAGYGFHNIFVFDNLYSYIYFVALLAMIDAQVSRPTRVHEYAEMRESDAAATVVPVVGVVAFAVVWMVNISGMQSSAKLIRALTPSPEGITVNLSLFQEFAQSPGFAAQEVREQIVSFAHNVVQASGASELEKQRAVALAVESAQAQVDAYPRDARARLQLAYAYRLAGAREEALAQVREAVALSPQKPDMYIEAGITAWSSDDTAQARTYFEQAYALNSAPRIATFAAAGAIGSGDRAAGEALLRKVHGTTVVDEDVLVAAYYRIQYWPGVIAILRARTEAPGADLNAWYGLAVGQYTAGQHAEAIRTLRTAAERFPSAQSTITAVIKQIEQGKGLR